MDAVFFDFDGVILDTANVKTNAFREMSLRFGEDISIKFMEYHLANMGISRFVKFKYLIEVLKKKAADNEGIEKLGKEFSEKVHEKIIAAPFVEGAYETLIELYQNKIPVFVVSGTPKEELYFIVRKRRLNRFIKEAHGSPPGKTEILQDIFSRYSFRPEMSLFVGDAMTDYNAAIRLGMKFLGIIPESGISPFDECTNVSKKVDVSGFTFE